MVFVTAAGNDGTYMEEQDGPLWNTTLGDVWDSSFIAYNEGASSQVGAYAYRGSSPAAPTIPEYLFVRPGWKNV